MSEQKTPTEKPWVCANTTCGRDIMTVLDIGDGKIIVRCIACMAQTPPLQFSLAENKAAQPVQ